MVTRTDRPRLSLNTMYASLAGAFVGALLLAVAVALGGQDGRLADGFLWGLYMLAFASVSGVVGFVFGVPRVRQDFRPEDSERYESNSNLEQISDWLTKLLVGAGLVQLVRIPGALRGLGDYLGGGFAISNGDAYAVSAVVFGVGLGFAAGYLWTRLKFRLLLEQSDSDAADASRRKVIVDGLQEASKDQDVSSSALRQVAEDALTRSSRSRPAERLPILWVDDNPSNNLSIVRALAALDIRVETTPSTAEALERLAGATYALIISDLGRMEGGENHQMAGLELLNALRDRSITTPVIIYAGARGVSRRQELEQAGARLVTQKPSEVFDEAVRTVTSS